MGTPNPGQQPVTVQPETATQPTADSTPAPAPVPVAAESPAAVPIEWSTTQSSVVEPAPSLDPNLGVIESAPVEPTPVVHKANPIGAATGASTLITTIVWSVVVLVVLVVALFALHVYVGLF